MYRALFEREVSTISSLEYHEVSVCGLATFSKIQLTVEADTEHQVPEPTTLVEEEKKEPTLKKKVSESKSKFLTPA